MASHLTRVVRTALARFGERVTRVEAHLADGKGKSGGAGEGVDCTLKASLPGLEPVIVKGHAERPHEAIGQAVNHLKRAVGSALSKHDPRYRPAQPLAAEDGEADAPDA